jgi:Tfp pilus assembly protein PilO
MMQLMGQKEVNTYLIKEAVLNFIVPLVSLTASAALFLLFIYPSLNNLPTLESDLAAKTDLDIQLKDKLANLNQLESDTEFVAENSSLVDNVLVSEAFVPALLTQIDSIAKEAGLEVIKLSYSLGADESEEAGVNYSNVTVSLGAKGTSSQQKQFMSLLENAARIVNMVNYRYSASDQEAGFILDATYALQAPYLYVESEAVTDDPINLDISASDFTSLINTLKSMRFYKYTTELPPELEELVEETTSTPEVVPEVIAE